MPPPTAPEPSAGGQSGRLGLALALPDGARLGLAVSGGADSLALLVLAHGSLKGRIEVATVDHGLRPDSAVEATGVADICAGLGIPHATLRPAVPLGGAGNIQHRARQLRYALLSDWARSRQIRHIATAHHRDDVAETFLMRALRGSGLGGLSRMRPSGPVPGAPDLILLRPLLDWARDDLAGLVADAGLTPALDPSNCDPRFDRARIRSLIARESELDPEQMARAAANLADAEDALDWTARQAWSSRVRTSGPASLFLDVADLPRELRRRLVARCVTHLDPNWTGEGLDGLVDSLEAGRAATLADVHVTAGPEWHFRNAPPRRGTD